MSAHNVLFERTGNESEYNSWWIQQQSQRNDQTLTMHDLVFSISKDVFSPSTETTNSVELLLNNFPDVLNKRVLDIGTGCGVLALKAAQLGAREVIGTDVRPAALVNAKQNVSSLHQEAVVKIIENEKFEELPGKFDVIIMNIIFADRPTHTDQIDTLGVQSLTLHQRLLSALPQMLNPGGVVLLGFGSFGDIETLEALLNSLPLKVSCVTEEKFGVNWYAITIINR